MLLVLLPVLDIWVKCFLLSLTVRDDGHVVYLIIFYILLQGSVISSITREKEKH